MSDGKLIDEDAVLPINVKWFSQELHESFRKHFIAWGDSTDWEKIAREALNSLSMRQALARAALSQQHKGTSEAEPEDPASR